MRSWREASQLCCHRGGARRDWKGRSRKKERPSGLAGGWWGGLCLYVFHSAECLVIGCAVVEMNQFFLPC